MQLFLLFSVLVPLYIHRPHSNKQTLAAEREQQPNYVGNYVSTCINCTAEMKIQTCKVGIDHYIHNINVQHANRAAEITILWETNC